MKVIPRPFTIVMILLSMGLGNTFAQNAASLIAAAGSFSAAKPRSPVVLFDNE